MEWLRDQYELDDFIAADYTLNQIIDLHSIKPWSCNNVTSIVLRRLVQNDDINTVMWVIHDLKCEIEDNLKPLLFEYGTLTMIQEVGSHLDLSGDDMWGALYSLAQRGHQDSINWAVGEYKWTLDEVKSRDALILACMSNHLFLAQWLNQDSNLLNDDLIYKLGVESFLHGHVEMTQWLLTQTSTDLRSRVVDRVLEVSAYRGYLDKIKTLVPMFKMPPDYPPLYQAVNTACANNHVEIVVWFIEYGVSPTMSC